MSAGTAFTGKTYVNEFGIGAVEMTVQPESVLSPWYSTDDRSSGVMRCMALTVKRHDLFVHALQGLVHVVA